MGNISDMTKLEALRLLLSYLLAGNPLPPADAVSAEAWAPVLRLAGLQHEALITVELLKKLINEELALPQVPSLAELPDRVQHMRDKVAGGAPPPTPPI